MERLRNIIREAVIKVITEGDTIPKGLVDANGKPIVTGKLVRPVDKSDKRWGKIGGVTIDLKVTVIWLDPDSKHFNKPKSAEDPKNIAIY